MNNVQLLEHLDKVWLKKKEILIRILFVLVNKEEDEKYLMSIVKVNTSDRTLTIDHNHSIHQFTTRLNPQGKFIQIDSKFDLLLNFLLFKFLFIQ
jgi:hypothetical protein